MAPEHPNVAIDWNNLGGAWKAKGAYDKAIGYYEKALASDLKTYGPEHPDVALNWNNLGGAWYAKERYEKAIAYYDKALSIIQHRLGEGHPYTQVLKRNSRQGSGNAQLLHLQPRGGIRLTSRSADRVTALFIGKPPQLLGFTLFPHCRYVGSNFVDKPLPFVYTEIQQVHTADMGIVQLRKPTPFDGRSFPYRVNKKFVDSPPKTTFFDPLLKKGPQFAPTANRRFWRGIIMYGPWGKTGRDTIAIAAITRVKIGM